ncbi:MAG: protease pro-enzyme activation domain-containing protein [Acidimicrobiales bacterium]
MRHSNPSRGRGAIAVAAASLLAVGLVACGGGGGPKRDPNVPASARVLVLFHLRGDEAGLAARTRATSDPDGPRYRAFPTVAQLAARWGASTDAVDHVVGKLREAGATATVDRSRTVVQAQMTADQVADVLGVGLRRAQGVDGGQALVPDRELQVPSNMRDEVVGVVGARGTLAAGPAPDLGGQVAEPPCRPGEGTVGGPTAVGERYGYDDYLFRDDVRGQGRRIAVLAIGRYEPAALERFASCYGTRPSGRVRVLRTPLAPKVQVGPEVTLDTIVASSFAPEAAIDVVQYDGGGSPASALVRVVDGPRYDAVSTSIGYCEADLSDAERALVDHLALVLSATGTPVLASSGDTGAAACHPASDRAAVQYPASSPWVLGVGGTTLRSGGGDLEEAVWNTSAPTSPQAGGGGPSHVVARPWYQRGLTVPGVAGTSKRVVPDVALLADPTLVPAIPLCRTASDCDWVRLAGTSAPAPALAAALALVSQDVAARAGDDGRLGLLQPLVRALATSGSPAVNDVTEGDNRVLGLPCCAAGPGYDGASGWGSLRADALADAVVAARPG